MAKKAKKPAYAAGLKKGEGSPVVVAITHKQLNAEVTRLSALADAVGRILHSTASSAERAALATFIEKLDATVLAASKIPCPNPMYNCFTVDGDRIGELP